MKSIQTKILLLVLTTALLTAIVIGGAGIFTAERIIKDNSRQVMNLMCGERALELDSTFSCIEQSVQVLADYALEQLDDVERFKTDNDYVEEYTKTLQSVAITTANSTTGAIAVYIRYNPEFTPPTSGLFWNKTESGDQFVKLTPTDLSDYEATDVEHVGWYYIPVEKKTSVWLLPYLNQNIDILMISYVIPLYKDNEVIGVVGMDIDYSVIIDMVKEIRVYESGYAFLTDQNNEIMYHQQYPKGTKMENLDSRQYAVVSRRLENDMNLVLVAPVAEINKEEDRLVRQIFVSVFFIGILFMVIAVMISRHIVKPLQELNRATQKIVSGDLSISLKPKTRDEIGTLTESFQITVCHLQEYMNYINGLAYQDSLTGIKNKLAYQDYVNDLEADIAKGTVKFGVVVFDVNNLKVVNDQYGHDCGDKLLKNVSSVISTNFMQSPVFRIGGDEFAAILEGEDYEQYQAIVGNFQQKVAEFNVDLPQEEKCSIAVGVAIYEPREDENFLAVFQRADAAMYVNKVDVKGQID